MSHRTYKTYFAIAALLVIGGLGALLLKRGSTEPGHQHKAASQQYWTCGMHPWVILPEPGDCPICGMDLVPLDPDKFSGEITIDPVTVQNMGVRIAEVTSGPLAKSIRTVGIVDYDEESVRDVNTKFSGWIEKLYVDSLGAQVKKGDPLFSIYSPELYSAQQDYLIARRGTNRSLIEAARTRLEYFDVTDEQIEALVKRGQPEKAIELESPFTGVVTEKHANEGMQVEPGMRVYRIADLSTVWVIVTVYEYQLPYLEVGQEAVMQLEYIPGQTFEGKITYIYPYLDKKTREAQVRLEFENPTGVLKPGMFASVELSSRLAADATLAPRSAIIDTGSRKVAIVSLGVGKFEPRVVETGVTTGDGKIQVRSGLKPGEHVVVSGQFLLDSEANMREALAKMLKGESAAEQKPEIAAADTGSLEKLPPAGSSALAEALTRYLSIQEALASDSMEGVSTSAQEFAEAVSALRRIEGPADAHFWHAREAALNAITAEAGNLAKSTELAPARLAFGNLSVPFRRLVTETGVPSSFQNPVLALHCPMFLEDQGGAVWLQTSEEVRNPYMGSRMLGCFDERVALPMAEPTPGEGQ